MAQTLSVQRLSRGKYRVTFQGSVWDIWHSFANDRWYGESKDHPGKMIDALTFSVAKWDLQKGYFVNCASAGL